jgi:hypothetical protein
MKKIQNEDCGISKDKQERTKMIIRSSIIIPGTSLKMRRKASDGGAKEALGR